MSPLAMGAQGSMYSRHSNMTSPPPHHPHRVGDTIPSKAMDAGSQADHDSTLGIDVGKKIIGGVGKCNYISYHSSLQDASGDPYSVDVLFFAGNYLRGQLSPNQFAGIQICATSTGCDIYAINISIRGYTY